MFSFHTSMMASILNKLTLTDHRQSELFEKKSLEERTKGGPSFCNPSFSSLFFALSFKNSDLHKHSFIK